MIYDLEVNASKNLNEEFLESLEIFNSGYSNHLKYGRSFQVGSSHVMVRFHRSNDHLVIFFKLFIPDSSLIWLKVFQVR